MRRSIILPVARGSQVLFVLTEGNVSLGVTLTRCSLYGSAIRKEATGPSLSDQQTATTHSTGIDRVTRLLQRPTGEEVGGAGVGAAGVRSVTPRIPSAFVVSASTPAAGVQPRPHLPPHWPSPSVVVARLHPCRLLGRGLPRPRERSLRLPASVGGGGDHPRRD